MSEMQKDREGYMTVCWRVADGYVGAGPHYSYVPLSELAICETDDEIEQEIEAHVRGDFAEKVHPEIDDMEAAIQACKAAAVAREGI